MNLNLYSVSNIDDFINDFNLMLDGYNTLGIGMDKSYSLVQYLMALYQPLIRKLFENCRSSLENNNDAQDHEQQEDYFKTKLNELHKR